MLPRLAITPELECSTTFDWEPKMKITKHAKLRMSQRGIKQAILEYMEYFLPQKYVNDCNKIVLTKKIAKIEAKKIRTFADNLEKHSGTEALLDKTGSDLITAYRKPSRK
jgi:hypothetical protein